MVNLLPKEKKTPKWLINWLITWLSVVCSLHKRFSTWKSLWWGRNIRAANEMLKTSLNLYWLQQNLVGWPTYNWWVYTNSLVAITITIKHPHWNFVLTCVENDFEHKLFPPFHVLCITLYLLTHTVENFCPYLAPKMVHIDDWCNNGAQNSRHSRGF